MTGSAIGAAGIHVLEDLRGLAHFVTVEDGLGAASMVRPPEEHMFRLGTNEAWGEAYRAGLQAGEHDWPLPRRRTLPNSCAGKELVRQLTQARPSGRNRNRVEA